MLRTYQPLNLRVVSQHQNNFPSYMPLLVDSNTHCIFLETVHDVFQESVFLFFFCRNKIELQKRIELF